MPEVRDWHIQRRLVCVSSHQNPSSTQRASAQRHRQRVELCLHSSHQQVSPLCTRTVRFLHLGNSNQEDLHVMTFTRTSAYQQSPAISIINRDINQTCPTRAHRFIGKCFIRKYLTRKSKTNRWGESAMFTQYVRDYDGTVGLHFVIISISTEHINKQASVT